MDYHDYTSEYYYFPYDYNDDECRNCTTAEADGHDHHNPLLTLEKSLLVLSLLVGVPANIAIIYRVTKPELRCITSTYILHRAVADLLFFIGDFFKVLGNFIGGWVFGDFMCRVMSGFLQVPVFASAMFLALMNVDLFIVLVRGKTQHKAKRQQVMRGGAAIVWTITFVVAIPVYIYSFLNADTRSCWVIPLMITIQQLSFLEMAIFIFCYVCPLCLCWSCYARYSKAPPTSLTSECCETIVRNKKMMLVLNSTFTVCQSVYWLSRSFPVPFHHSISSLVVFIILHYCLELSLVVSAVSTFYYKTVKKVQPAEPPIALPLVSS